MRTSPTLLLLLSAGCSSSTAGGELPLRRLTSVEYNNTIRDLYGFPLNDAWPSLCERAADLCDEGAEEEAEEGEGSLWPFPLPDDVEVHHFQGMAEGQIASNYYAERTQAAATHFAPYALVAPYFSGCGDWNALPADEAQGCVEESLIRFTQRAWRRPVTEDELERLLSFARENTQTWGLDRGVVLTVSGVLQSPQFIYLLDSPEAAAEDPWALASRLSYFLWDSMPDQELFEAAAKGKLSTQAQVRRQAERMVGDVRAREAVVEFHRQWLGLEDVYSALPDMSTYAALYLPGLLEVEGEGLQEIEEFWSGNLIGLRRGMLIEAEKFIEHTIFDGGGTLGTLLTDNHGFVTDVDVGYPEVGLMSTANLYGVTSDKRYQAPIYRYEMDDGNLGITVTVQAAELPADQRSGLLTLGAVLTAQAHPVHPAPVLRGVMVLERLACQHLGQPPDGAAGQAPADTPDAESTNRARLEAVTQGDTCVGCHQMINPAGFAFENFDSVGGWRTQDNGQPVDASGALTLDGEAVSFSGAVELGRALSTSRTVHDCYASSWTRYALGRTDTNADAAAIAELQEGFFTDSGDVRGLLVDIASSDLFRGAESAQEN